MQGGPPTMVGGFPLLPWVGAGILYFIVYITVCRGWGGVVCSNTHPTPPHPPLSLAGIFITICHMMCNGCGRQEAAATHRKRGGNPPFAVGGVRPPQPPTAKGGTHPPWGAGPSAWWAESDFPRVSNLAIPLSHLIL